MISELIASVEATVDGRERELESIALAIYFQ